MGILCCQSRHGSICSSAPKATPRRQLSRSRRTTGRADSSRRRPTEHAQTAAPTSRQRKCRRPRSLRRLRRPVVPTPSQVPTPGSSQPCSGAEATAIGLTPSILCSIEAINKGRWPVTCCLCKSSEPARRVASGGPEGSRLGQPLHCPELARVASAREERRRQHAHRQVQTDQDRRDRGKAGVRLVELVDELPPVARGENEPEAGDAEQRKP